MECRDPFDVWLGQTEAKLSQWNRVDYGGKDVLVEQTEALKAFKTDVELHSHDLVSCETLGGKFIETAKVRRMDGLINEQINGQNDLRSNYMYM